MAPGKISGFPEWLPEQKILENKLIETIRSVYESYGFAPIETPAVELVSTLASKGVVDKEIFAVKRLKDEGSEEAELALHFDLTVPFARYVAQHAKDLVFPFKRYQVQKVWRGDRPQRGRFREFYQFDNDTVARNELPISCDAEGFSAISQALKKIEVPSFVSRVNNRKVLQGFYRSLGLTEDQRKQAIICVDKLDKIGISGVEIELTKALVGSVDKISMILDLAQLRSTPAEFRTVTKKFAIEDEWFEMGLSELEKLFSLLPSSVVEHTEVDFSLARGLDYYTGLIAEFVFPEHREFGTFAGGGRYDNLASDFTKEKLPGVGFSIGFSRLFDLILSKSLLPLGSKSASQLLVSVYAEEQRSRCNQIAEEFRSQGVACEVYYLSPKLGRQIEYAEAKGMRYVAFLNAETGALAVKDIQTKQQVEVNDIAVWSKELV